MSTKAELDTAFAALSERAHSNPALKAALELVERAERQVPADESVQAFRMPYASMPKAPGDAWK